MQKENLRAPLVGVRVLDISKVLAGPYCSMILGDLGAEIIKVEPLGGDDTRAWGPPFVKGESAYYLSINRNKKSICIDLKNPKGRNILLDLSSKSDVFLENLRPGATKDLKIDYEAIRRVNPQIIYCSISGFGQEGPLSQKPGYDIVAYAASGIMDITGYPDQPPVKTGVPIADIGGSLYACIGIISALYGRSVTKKGTYIDISLLDGQLSWLTFQAGIFFATGSQPPKLGSAHPTIAPYQAFKAQDKYFIVAVGTDEQWSRFCSAVGLEQLAKDGRFVTNEARVMNRGALVELVEKHLASEQASFWLKKLEEARVPCGPINSLHDILLHPHTFYRKMVVETCHPKAGKIKTIGMPIKFSNYNFSVNYPPPSKGEHSAQILRDMGYPQSEIDILFREKVIA
jgi:crotonobetainyl-CoA:carnitine CoA-transferase CaiB-like acyl-CoA transferase